MYYKVILAYEGTRYHGWERQPTTPLTLQAVVEGIFTASFGAPATTLAAGRTDAGVHALGQCLRLFHPRVSLSPHQLVRFMNAMLPPDIRVVDVEVTDAHFQPRYTPHQKVYRYVIETGPYDLFHRHLAHQYNRPVSLPVLREGAACFVGRHDFAAFSTSALTDTVRMVREITCTKHGTQIWVTVVGDGFLRSMVRMIVGTLLALNEERVTMAEIQNLLEHPAKGAAHWKAPAEGLYLVEVMYPERG